MQVQNPFPNYWTEVCATIRLGCQDFFQTQPTNCLEVLWQRVITPFVYLLELSNEGLYSLISFSVGQKESLNEQIVHLYQTIIDQQKPTKLSQTLNSSRYPYAQHLINVFDRKSLEEILPSIQKMKKSHAFLHQNLATPLLQREQKRHYVTMARMIQQSWESTDPLYKSGLLILTTSEAEKLKELCLADESAFLFYLAKRYTEKTSPPPILFWALLLYSDKAAELCEKYPQIMPYWFDILKAITSFKKESITNSISNHWPLFSQKKNTTQGIALINSVTSTPSSPNKFTRQTSSPERWFVSIYYDCDSKEVPPIDKRFLKFFYNKTGEPFQAEKTPPEGGPLPSLTGQSALKEMFRCVNLILNHYAFQEPGKKSKKKPELRIFVS